MIITTRPVLLQVTYYIPDYPSLLQEFTWGFDDKIPGLHRTHRFLRYWHANIDAVIANIMLSINDAPFTQYRSIEDIITMN